MQHGTVRFGATDELPTTLCLADGKVCPCLLPNSGIISLPATERRGKRIVEGVGRGGLGALLLMISTIDILRSTINSAYLHVHIVVLGGDHSK